MEAHILEFRITNKMQKEVRIEIRLPGRFELPKQTERTLLHAERTLSICTVNILAVNPLAAKNFKKLAIRNLFLVHIQRLMWRKRSFQPDNAGAVRLVGHLTKLC